MKRTLLIGLFSFVVLIIGIGCSPSQTRNGMNGNNGYDGSADTMYTDTTDTMDFYDEEYESDTMRNGMDGMNGSALFKEWDMNNDNSIDTAEFCSMVRDEGLFSEFDTDNNNMISESEFIQSAFALLDQNMNGTIEENEWSMYEDTWFSGNDTFSDWDRDNDSKISPQEFAQGIRQTNVLEKWDMQTNGLTFNEFCTMAFSAWDMNGNGKIDNNEWNTLYSLWLE